MFVARFPDWSTSIVYKDGTKIYFDGPKDLFKYFLNLRKYERVRKRADVAFLGVKDYYSLNLIDGREAYFVAGSNVNGPMGKELIPFAKKGDAKGFEMDHQGVRVLRFKEITQDLLNALE
jgi:nitrous oxide reductase accessory protein NosL